MRLLNHLIIGLLTFLFHSPLMAQGSINGPQVVCLGDLANFSYTPPSGLSLSSIAWDFGDGNSSSNSTPSHTYLSTGQYRVKVNANFTNSTSAQDSMTLNVYGLPKPFLIYGKVDTCLNRNLVCFKDTSSPAVPGQTIVERLFVWGDGTFFKKNSPAKNDTFCHTYQVASTYNLRMELTDNRGCKNSVSRDIHILENVKPSFTIKRDFYDCKNAQICIRNTSSGAPLSNMHFRWLVDSFALDTGLYFNSSKCVQFSRSKSGIVKLIAFGNSVCRDSMSLAFNVTVDSLPSDFWLLDTVRCSSEEGLQEVSIKPLALDSMCWYLDNAPILLLGISFNKYFSTYKINPGLHTVKLNIFRGNCVHTLSKDFRLLGPVASILSIDNIQCFSDRKVYFVDNSRGIDRNRCTFNWDINDPNGDNCTKHQAKNQNLNLNCNRAKDWFFKHQIADFTSQTYYIGMRITDTVSGCSDTATAFAYSQCSPILKPDTFYVCKGSLFKDRELAPFADSFTLDSGKTWFKFPSILPNTYNGTYDLGFKFRNDVSPWAEDIGNDSLKIHSDSATFFHDVYRSQKMIITDGIKDSITVKEYGACRPFRTSIFFKNGNFLKGESLKIYWGDSGNIEITFTQDTHIDSFIHYYNRTAVLSQIQIYLENVHGCTSYYSFDVNLGKTLNAYTPKFINCRKDSVCFTPYIYSIATQSFWPGNTPNNKVSWYFPMDNKKVNRFTACHRFSQAGMNPFQLIVLDSFGCIDTLFDTVFVQDLRAQIKNSGKKLYCNELKQFFDSSTYLRNPAYHPFLPVFYRDSAIKYSWRFGDNVYSSFQKNPLQSITTSLDSIRASLAVEMASGCSDTFHFTIQIIGPKPYFYIKDTVGCGSLEATFLNASRNTRFYIWHMGDSLNTQLNKNNKDPFKFIYDKPGRYHISLTGIDTIFNPLTNKMQACVARYPDPLFQKDSSRSVLVLPHLKTGLSSKDTICIGSPLQLTSFSDTGYFKDLWDMGDSSTYTEDAPSTITHTYKKEGNYLIKLNPFYADSLRNTCRDSASKTVVVMGVKADFDIDPNTLPPLFQFYNKSIPASAALNWNFGQPGPNNTSTAQNPSKHYGNDTGSYLVCLIASIDYGCQDTICKIVFNDHLNDFGIYNVFTPGKKDELNDKYDIQIEGESLYDLKIYNRWGVLVYESDQDYDNTVADGNWNGRVMNTGEECPAGTYYYMFRYSLRNSPDKIETIQGIIHLIR